MENKKNIKEIIYQIIQQYIQDQQNFERKPQEVNQLCSDKRFILLKPIKSCRFFQRTAGFFQQKYDNFLNFDKKIELNYISNDQVINLSFAFQFQTYCVQDNDLFYNYSIKQLIISNRIWCILQQNK
ncbi:hypothetical protein pb186bvf_009824 [Paramecium bursaria]